MKAMRANSPQDHIIILRPLRCRLRSPFLGSMPLTALQVLGREAAGRSKPDHWHKHYALPSPWSDPAPPAPSQPAKGPPSVGCRLFAAKLIVRSSSRRRAKLDYAFGDIRPRQLKWIRKRKVIVFKRTGCGKGRNWWGENPFCGLERCTVCGMFWRLFLAETEGQ